MNPDYRAALTNHIATLDQLQSETEDILRGPGDAEIGCRAEELRELIIEMQALVEGKLDREMGLGIPELLIIAVASSVALAYHLYRLIRKN